MNASAVEMLEQCRAALARIGKKFERGGLTQDEALAQVLAIGGHFESSLLAALEEWDGEDPLSVLAALLPDSEDMDSSMMLDREAVLGTVLTGAMPENADARWASEFGSRLRGLPSERLVTIMDVLSSACGLSIVSAGMLAWVVDELAVDVSPQTLDLCCGRLAMAATEEGDSERAWRYLRTMLAPYEWVEAIVVYESSGPNAELAADLYRWAVELAPERPPVAEEIACRLLIGDVEPARQMFDDALGSEDGRDRYYDWILMIAGLVLGRFSDAEVLARKGFKSSGYIKAIPRMFGQDQWLAAAEMWVLALTSGSVAEQLDFLWHAMDRGGWNLRPEARTRLDTALALLEAGDLLFAGFFLNSAETALKRPLDEFIRQGFGAPHFRPAWRLCLALDRLLVGQQGIDLARARLNRALDEAGFSEEERLELEGMMSWSSSVESWWLKQNPLPKS